MKNKKTSGIKIMGQPMQTIGEQKEKERKKEIKEYKDQAIKRIKKSANHPANKITGKDMWAMFKEISFTLNNMSDRMIRLEMFFENLQEYINKTGKLEILNKSDEFNQPIKKDKKI